MGRWQRRNLQGRTRLGYCISAANSNHMPDSPPSVVAKGVMLKLQTPSVRIGSKIFCTGVHCVQNRTAHSVETAESETIVNHINILCHLSTTIRSRKKPRESFATAIPTTANVCPIILVLIASAASSNSEGVASMLGMGRPNPCRLAMCTKTVYSRINTCTERC